MNLVFALYVLMAPLDLPNTWGWTFIDGPFESEALCNKAKDRRLDQDKLICAKLR